jgi:hypothetical protein
MVNDFETLMPIKDIIVRNGFKNEYYKQKFNEDGEFD